MAKNVLLIEYEQRDRSRVSSVLALPEFQVTEAHDGAAGLVAFGSSRFDVVLLSSKLPRHSATDVIREIRNKGGPAAPPIVLLMAGYAGSNPKADAQKIGAFEIVPKPFTDEALLGAVRSALEATDRGAKTIKTAVGSLTAKDIFSDLLEELGRETGAAPKVAASAATSTPPRLPAPAPRTRTADDEIERRLRDTLSGVRVTTRPTPSAAVSTRPPSAVRPRAVNEDEIDRMLSETLRIRIPRSKTAPGVTSAPSTAPPPVAEAASSGPDRFGQYELLERIASGGMAELFRARRSGVEGFQKIVAIKKILPHIADNEEFITMFADEAKLAAELNHPNIVHIHDLGKIESGGYFIAMEYVEGIDLRTILRSGRERGMALPVPLAVYVASKVASALDYAHRRRDARGEELRIVHRDVSPQNILISHEGEIKLCDFGIAKADRKVSRTETGSLKGKLQYMSPEQAWGRPIDHRSDLFSLGCVLHEMLTGERLFRGDSDMTVLEMVRKAEVYPPSRVNADVPAPLDLVVLKSLAREPEERYATGSEMLRDLESVLYSYTPAPGSADLAIYLHRLREVEAAAAAPRAASVEQAPIAPTREAPTAAPPPAPRVATAPPPAAAPAGAARKKPADAEVFGSFSPARLESERRKRTPLFIGMAAVLIVGGALALFVARKSPAPAAAPAPAPAATAAPLASVPPAAIPTPVAVAALDQKAIEQEIQRQLAAKRQEMQKAAGQPGRPTAEVLPRKTTASPAVAVPPAPATEPPRVEPTSPPSAPTAAPEPTLVAVAAPPAEAVPAPEERAPAPRETAPAEPEVSRGDLVGPGPGVSEPTLLAPPRIAYPPLARQQRVAGRVVVLVLVNEEGTVSEARLQKGVGGRTGLDGMVVEAVRGARFRPATKNGIPVKMWRTVVVDVKP